MKKQFFILLFAIFSTTISGQVNEIGLFFGGSNFIGDVGRTNYVHPNEFAGGIIYKWNWNPRLALRSTLSYIPLSANDATADNPGRTNRGAAFKSTIYEAAIGLEFNFFNYEISTKETSWTPYALVELAAFEYSKGTATAIPFGVGIKSKLFHRLTVALETKFRYTFVDDIDQTPTSSLEKAGNDWYAFTGITLNYTFGKPSCFKKRM